MVRARAAQAIDTGRAAAEMRVPKGYKQTEIGVIPEDWGTDYISNLACIATGGRNTQDRVDNGQYPFFVRSQTVERINSYSFDGEAVLTAGDGVGTGKVFHYINGKFDAHQRVYQISNFNDRINGFFFYLYFSNHFYNRIMQMTAKSSVDSVRMEMIAKMIVPLPPTKAEQEAIAGALSDAEALIEALEQLISKKRQIKQGAIQELLTGKKRLPGFSGKWDMRRLEEIGTTFGGLTRKGKKDFGHGAGHYITFMNIMSNVVIDCNAFEAVDVTSSETQNRVAKGDLFFNGSSETPEEVGMCAILTEDVQDVFLNSFCFGFRFREESLADGLYLAYYFRSREGRELLKSLAQGATRYNLSKTAFVKVSFSLPQLKEQKAIAAILSDMDADIAALEEKLAKARMVKQGMMQELLTGRIRLI